MRAIRRDFEKLGVEGELEESNVLLNYDSYRLAFRDVAASTNERTVIATILPPKRFCPHTVSLEQVHFDSVSQLAGYVCGTYLSQIQRLYLGAMLNSFVFDWFIRLSITSHVSFFFVYNTPVPRLDAHANALTLIASRAARLICTTPEFDDLAQAVGLTPTTSSGRTEYGTTDPTERAKLRAELDGLVAHLYGLSEEEFTHILGTFPLVAQPVKVAAHNAYRDVERGLIK
jgi:hypothetical protein